MEEFHSIKEKFFSASASVTLVPAKIIKYSYVIPPSSE